VIEPLEMALPKGACACGLWGAPSTPEDKPVKRNATKLLCKFLNLQKINTNCSTNMAEKAVEDSIEKVRPFFKCSFNE
jgi:hypothetical protein